MSKRKELINDLKSGKVVAMPSDTIYGLSAKALDKSAVEKIYKLKKRQSEKPLIVLVSSWPQLRNLGISLSKEDRKFLRTIWPGRVSVILSCPNPKLEYLHRNKNLAVRWPKNKFLSSLIKKTGPLVSSSTNLEGHPPAETTEEAKKYFGNQIDKYYSAGRKLKGKPSTIIDIVDKKITIIREGRYPIKKIISKYKKIYD